MVAIANRGLQKIGATRITALTDNSVSARAVNACIEELKLAELRDHPWNFSIKRATLAADDPAPDWGRENSYTLPADFVCLRPDYPEDNSNDKDWQIEGRKILTNDSAPIYVRYTYDVTDANEMDPLFREALACRVAIETCEELTQSNIKKADLKDDYEKIISRAKKANAIENVAQVPPEDEWLSVRR